MIHVAFNTFPLQTGHVGRGTGMYTKNLLDRLKKSENISVSEFTSSVPKDADIIHYPFFDPFFLTLPIYKSKPVIVTVHDLIPLVYPQYFPRGLRGELKWQVQKRSLRNASHIITDSHASKEDIVRIIGYPEKNISVIYLAPNERFCPHPKKETERVNKKYGLPARFLLYVGDINPNKNIPFLLNTLSSCKIPIVFVGKAFIGNNTNEIQEIDSLISSLKMNQRVYKLGYVPDEDLPGLYCAAAATVFPSFAEGFGLPVLESMACLTPTLVADSSSLKEIAGPATRFDPYRSETLANAIHTILDGKRSSIVLGYKEWVSRFTWEKTAQQTIAVYNTVLGNNI